MIISISLVRKTFFFIGDVALRKGADPVDVDISTRSDMFIAAICSAIRNNVIEANIEVQDLVGCIKDIPSRIMCQRNLGLTPDTVAVVEVVVEQAAEVDKVDEVVEDIENEEEGKEEGLLVDLLDGNVKQVIVKIKIAELSDE